MPPFRSTGGKKGMRQVSHKNQKKIALRPAPERVRTDQDESTSFTEAEEKTYDDYSDEEGHDRDQYGYRESLKEEQRPLTGYAISVSGCSGSKEDLLKTAEEYGAARHGGLQEDTTHLVTDKCEGAKYRIALERRMKVMMPSWLPAVRDAWKSGEVIDWNELEDEHRMLPLVGVVFTMTQFAQGYYKDDFRNLLTSSGAEYVPKLDSTVTHLIVASTKSPHSQTPSSEKLLHARKNRRALRQDFSVVWEGWAREAIQYGGRRDDRDKTWVYEAGKAEPTIDLSWAVEDPPPSRSIRPDHSVLPEPSIPALRRSGPSSSSRVLVGGGASTSARRFTGYDNSINEALEEPNRQSTSHDLANGKILKKRRKTAGPDASQGNPDQLINMFGEPSHIHPNQPRTEATDSTFALPHPDDLGTDLPIPPPRFESQDQDMVYEMKDGEVGLQRTKKSKSAIKAVSSKRALAHVETGKSIPKQLGYQPRPPIEEAGVDDDSAFFEGGHLASEEATSEGQQGGGEATSQGSTSTVFNNLSFALMGIKAREPELIAKVIESAGGFVTVDARGEALDRADYIVVDFADPPRQFFKSEDPRVVSVCWIELCLWAEQVLDVEDRLLDRPIPYQCPVPGARQLKVHFSGYAAEEDPLLHHNRRFLFAVGATLSDYLDRSCTHLVLAELDHDSSLDPAQVDGAANRKVSRAREWGIEVCSMRSLRDRVAEMATEAENEKENTPTHSDRQDISDERRGNGFDGGKGKAANDGYEEETLGGPLSDCVVYFSTKADIDRPNLAHIVQDLGGTAARQYSDAVTHFVHCGPKGNDSYKDYKSAKSDGCIIVHPRWVEECGRTSSRASELDFPRTFDSKKGGQLFDVGINMVASPPHAGRISPSVSRGGSSRPEEHGLKRKSELDFDVAESRRRQSTDLQRSPTPRRRRSDSTRTEIADEAKTPPSPVPPRTSTSPRPAIPATSSSPPARRALDSSASSSSAPQFPASDVSPIPQLSKVPASETNLAHEADKRSREEEAKAIALKQRTELLWEQMKVVPNARSKTLNKKTSLIAQPVSPRKQLSPNRTTSLPTLLPSSSPSRVHALRPFNEIEGTQLSQSQYPTTHAGVGGAAGGGGKGEDQTTCVRYDNAEQARAKERIQERLKNAQASSERVVDGEASQIEKRVTRSARKSR